MKKTFFCAIELLLSLLITVSHFGCASTEPPKNEVTSETALAYEDIRLKNEQDADYVTSWNPNANYKIEKIGSRFYLIFDDPDEYKDWDVGIADVQFESIRVFRDTVTQGKLEEWQKAVVAKAFPRDDVGIPICDFNNLFIPKLPSPLKVAGICWNGETYSYSFIESEYGRFGYLYCYTKEKYDTKYQSDYVHYFERDTITVASKEYAKDRNAEITYYSTPRAQLKKVRYEMQNNGNHIVVDEEYTLSIASNLLETSDTVPSSIKLYVTNGDVYFAVSLFGFSARPTAEWLSSFSVALWQYE